MIRRFIMCRLNTGLWDVEAAAHIIADTLKYLCP